MEQAGITIFTGVFIAVITSWLTVQFSLKQFRDQKWWEKKANTYERILEALHKSKKFSDEHLKAEYTNRDVKEERNNELRKQANESREEILRAIDVGAFYLSDEAVQILKKYDADTDDLASLDTWYEYLDADNTICHRTLEKLIVIAKQDLKR